MEINNNHVKLDLYQICFHTSELAQRLSGKRELTCYWQSHTLKNIWKGEKQEKI